MILVAAIGVASRSIAAEPLSHASDVNSPLSAEEALQQFVVHPKLQIELVAAEPEVIDPVAMAFDEHGRLWVVEMRDYPFGPQDGEPPQSRIKLLEDRDGDGRYETGHTFADGLLFATGVQPWRGGVIVTLSGEISWLADTDGDHRADVHQTWFRGFAERNPQLRANDPTFWFDGKVYVAGGLHHGGTIVTAHAAWQDVNGTEPIDLGQRDFRFDPHTGRASAIAGGAQYGLAFDAFGNRFVCSNSRPIEHVVLEERHLTRNERVRLTQTNERVITEREDRRLFPLSRQETTSYLHEGHFTAACGLLLYGGDALPEEFRGNAFICEPTGSLVHREVLTPAGATFAARPGREGVEFLASRDSWFRPVFLSEGPDGALYVVDMYRAVIEHPEWFADLSHRSDLTAGKDRGRIWRIAPRRTDARPTRSETPPRNETDGELAEWIASLEHPNAWHRLTASRLIFEQREDIDAQSLRKLVTGGGSPEAKSGVLHILDGLGQLTADDVLAALDDRDTDVRRVALRLAESQVEESKPLQRWVRQIALDLVSERRESFAATLTAGAAPTESQRALVQLVAQFAADDEWMRAAILSLPVMPRPAELDDLCRALAVNSGQLSEGQRIVIEQLAEQIGLVGTDAQVGDVLAATASDTEEIVRARLLPRLDCTAARHVAAQVAGSPRQGRQNGG
jgi:putative membrane-bound dehydrogenase-like protein